MIKILSKVNSRISLLTLIRQFINDAYMKCLKYYECVTAFDQLRVTEIDKPLVGAACQIRHRFCNSVSANYRNECSRSVRI